MHAHSHHGHSHGHGHHHHGHGHSHAPASFGHAFAIGIALNGAFVAVEFAAGVAGGSVALLADAGHNLSDVAGLLVAWAGAELSKRPASARFTYGLRSSSILAALFNSVLLLVAVGAIALEAVQRFGAPHPVPGRLVMIVAAFGIVINLATALLFARGRHGDANIRAAFLHMASDAVVSLGVVAAGGLILLTGYGWIDPVVSLLINAVILWSTWGLLTEAVSMALQAVPAHIDPARVADWLSARPGVSHIHDLHIWPTSTTDVALTAHLVMPAGHPGDAFLTELQHELAHDFGIAHATVQIELSDAAACRMDGHGARLAHR
jgi:cobalt-zinc-cadmium efflux system protein